MEVSRLWGRVGLNYDDVREGARRVTGLLGDLKSTFLTLGTQAASTAAGFLIRDVVVGSWNRLNQAIRQTGAEMVGANRQWEQFEARFATLLKSEEAARQRLSDLEQFGILTPFNLDQVIEADILLQNFGLHAANAAQRFGKSGEDIRRIAGDTAAGVGASFTEIAMWLGRFAAGDTGRAIMRMQELGVTTRQELAAMGVEFNKAGSLTTPVDEAMTALLQIMEDKFGGLMDVQSATLGGMESNLEDWMDRQKRLWGEPVADSYKNHLQDLLGFLDSDMAASWMETGRELFASAVGWLDDVLVEWGHKLGQLAVDAFEWGANIVRQFASGIEGSGYVADSLQRIADDIAYWLMPGSPPRLLPDLPEWGKGALEAYLSGWEGVGSPDVKSYLADALKSLEPYLKDGVFSDDERKQMQQAFGGRSDIFEGYVTAQAKLRTAANETAAARLALTDAEASGDADAIAAAKDRLELAETEEQKANEKVREEERRVAKRLEAEFALAKAIQQQTNAVDARDQREAKAHADAEARAAEAEARAIKEAKLRYELAVAETPSGQLSIWERELQAAQEGSAEWYDISTRIVQLQQRIRDEMARAGGAGTGPTLAQSLLAPVSTQEITDFWTTTDSEVQKVDWGTIGKTIASALWNGVWNWTKEQAGELANKLFDWASSSETLNGAQNVGGVLGQTLIGGIKGVLGIEPDETAASMETHLWGVAFKAGSAALKVGGALADGVIFGVVGGLTGADPAEIAAAWELGMGGGRVDAALRAKWFHEGDMAAVVAEQWRAVSENEALAPAVQEAAAKMYQKWLDAYGMVDAGELGIMAAEDFLALGTDQGVLDAANSAGEKAGYSFVGGVTASLKQLGKVLSDWMHPESQWNTPGAPARYASGTSYAPGGWAIVGEQGPELVRLPRGSQVLPATETARAMQGQGQTINITIHAPNGDAREVEIGVIRGLRAVGVY